MTVNAPLPEDEQHNLDCVHRVNHLPVSNMFIIRRTVSMLKGLQSPNNRVGIDECAC